MAHREQLEFIHGSRNILSEDLSEADILEIGSCDVNGTIRRIFSGYRSYIGVDLAPGPGVDTVGSGHDLRLPDNSFALTLSCECFEHNPFWLATFMNMHRMTRPDGYVLITCGSLGRIEHGTARTTMSDSPGTSALGINYYRNLTKADFTNGPLRLADMFSDYVFWYIKASSDLYFVGRKRGTRSDRDLSMRYASLIEGIESLSARSRGAVRQALFALYRLPLNVIANILDDQHFQGFAVAYDRLFGLFKTGRRP
jgi:SAM-dependent methyltransferase